MKRNLLSLPIRWIVVLPLLLPHLPAAEMTGTLTGFVSNTATGNLLEGARVEVPTLGLTALTDPTGRFVISPIPPGTHEVHVSYTGLDSVRAEVAIGSGQRAVRNFDLTSGIYRMDQFKVTGEREGRTTRCRCTHRSRSSPSSGCS
jgi:hypothetical protein